MEMESVHSFGQESLLDMSNFFYCLPNQSIFGIGEDVLI